MVSLIAIGYSAFVGVLVIVGTIIIYRVWKNKHNYKIRIRRLTSNNTKVIRDGIGKLKKDRQGILYLKAFYGIMQKPLPIKLPVPSADVTEYDSKSNRLIVEAWYDEVRGITYIKDPMNVETLNSLNDQEGFRVFPTNSREMLINQLNIAKSMQPRNLPEAIMYMTPFVALIMILTIFMIFFGKVVGPIEASAQNERVFKLEWQDNALQIQQSQADLMNKILGYERNQEIPREIIAPGA
jgi:hypothetical protein